MKKFKFNSILFIVVIAIIFCCNVYYLVSLYYSIHSDVEREVLTALADTDIDDMWERSERARMMAETNDQPVLTKEEVDSMYYSQHGSITGHVDESGDFVTSTNNESGVVTKKRFPLMRDHSHIPTR